MSFISGMLNKLFNKSGKVKKKTDSEVLSGENPHTDNVSANSSLPGGDIMNPDGVAPSSVSFETGGTNIKNTEPDSRAASGKVSQVKVPVKAKRSKLFPALIVTGGLAIVLGGVYVVFGDTIMEHFFPSAVRPPHADISKSVQVEPSQLPSIGDTPPPSPDGTVLPLKDNAVDNMDTISSFDIIQDFSSAKKYDFNPDDVLSHSVTADAVAEKGAAQAVQKNKAEDKPLDQGSGISANVPSSAIVAVPSGSVVSGVTAAGESSSGTADAKKAVSAKAEKPKAAKATTDTSKKVDTKAGTKQKKPAKAVSKQPVKQASKPKQEVPDIKKSEPIATPERFAKRSPNEPLITKENAAFEINNLVLKANHALRDGNNEGALELFEIAYKYNKKPDLEYNIIFLSIKTGDIEKAKRMLCGTWLPDADAGELLQDMYDSGYAKEAAECTKLLLPKDSGGNVYYFAGYLSEMEGNYSDASSNYRRAMIKSNYDPYFTFAYARTQDIMENYEEASNYYRVVAGQTENRELRIMAAKRVDDIFNM